MKIFVVENNNSTIYSGSENPCFSLRPETCLLRNNQSFFFPSFSNEISCRLSLVVRTTKIGRCVYEKFAHRYYDQIGVGLCFTANDLLQKQKSMSMPIDNAQSFDFSTPLSAQFLNLSDLGDVNNIDFKLNVNGALKQAANTKEMLFGIDKIIAHISQFVSLKIGDLIFINPIETNYNIVIGDNLQAFIADEKLLDFIIE